MDNFKITPLFSMDAEQLQELTAPTGKFTRDCPKCASDAKIVSGENTRRDGVEFYSNTVLGRIAEAVR